MNKDYKYIVIEGNIGAGKTSLASMISEQFGAKLLLERFADNPFLPKFYENPGRYSFPLELSFLADRYQQLKGELGSIDMFSPFTIADYYFMKSLIFASSTLEEDEYNLYRQIFHIIHSSLPKPDLYVYLHVPAEKLLKNIACRGRNYESSINAEYLSKIQDSYFAYFRQNQNYKYLILNIENIDFVTNKRDYRKIVDAIFETDHSVGIKRLFF